MIGLCSIVMGPPVDMPDRCPESLSKSTHARSEWFTRWLSMDEKQIIKIDDVFDIGPNPFGGADISVIIKFQPWYLPFTRTAEFRFVTKKERDGRLIWVPRPVFK